MVNRLPPLWEVNHRIPLIEESKHYAYHLPRCTDALKQQLSDKIQLYMDANWWVMKSVPQATLMLCIPTKSGKLWTVIDCHKRNDNTVKDVIPFLDQDQIRMDITRAKYHSKIDLSNAYEQVRIELEDIWKTAFATIYGTFISQVMQQGDCNAPAMFQCLMTVIFRDHIGRCVYVYLDDIFIYSDTLEDHEQFVGLVKYLAQFMPEVSAYAMPLTGIQRNRHPFKWREVHNQCFQMIKDLACKYPILKPIDLRKKEPIWLVCNTSLYGVSALYIWARKQLEDMLPCRVYVQEIE